MKMYKGFDKDLKCRGFQFEVGKKYHQKGEIKACYNGFHACLNIIDVFNFYSFNNDNRFCIVELEGDLQHEDNKSVGSDIEIIKELTINEVLELANIGKNNTGIRNSGDRNSGGNNSGDRNSGDRNSGNWNSGDRNSGNWNSGGSNSGNWNSGYRNSGNWNSGDWNSGGNNSGDWNSGNWNSGDWNSGGNNSGDWNSCNFETGYFNSKQDNYIRVFNKKCKKEIWDNAIKPNFIYDIILTKWIPFEGMTDEEKKNDADAYFREGYLKKYTYKEAWFNAYKNASKEDIELLKALPNFNAKVFEEITGIEL